MPIGNHLWRWITIAILGGLLVANNPSPAAYSRLLISALQARLGSSVLGGAFNLVSASALPYIVSHTTRTNFLLFSIYRTSTPIGTGMFVGIMSEIVPLSLPHWPTPATATQPPPSTASQNAPSNVASGSSACPASSQANLLAAVRSCIVAADFTPAHAPSAQLVLPNGQTLTAWPTVATGSADGYDQRMFFFLGRHQITPVLANGRRAKTGTVDILKVLVTGSATITVEYAHYRSSDPLCCPTGTPIAVRYRWTNSALVATANAPDTQ